MLFKTNNVSPSPHNIILFQLDFKEKFRSDLKCTFTGCLTSHSGLLVKGRSHLYEEKLIGQTSEELQPYF